MLFGAASPGKPSFGDLSWKRPVDSAQDTGAGLSASTLAPVMGYSFRQTLTKNTNGSINAEAAFTNGPFLGTGARILVNIEAAPKNGIYIVTTVGGVGTPWQLTRATDADSVIDLPVGSTTIGLNASIVGGYAVYTFDGTHWIMLPQTVADLILIGGTGLNIVNGGLTIAKGPRPASAVYSFVGALNTATGTITLNVGNIGGGTSRVPFAGRIIGVSISPSTNRTAGSATAHATINGVQKNVLAPAANAGTPTGGIATSAYAGADTFAAGDTIRANVVTAGYAPVNGNVTVDVFVIFDSVA